VLSYAETRRQADLPYTQVGIEMWFKASRKKFNRHDCAALTWWLERKLGGNVIVREVDFILARNIDTHSDPLSARTYSGDGSWVWGSGDGQIRVGGGVKGWI
jgi:hypothetical protein